MMFSPRSRPIARPLFSFYFFFCCMIGVMMPYLSVHFKDIGLSGSEIGKLYSLITLSTIVAPHFWGWLAVKLGLPRVTLQLAIIGAFITIIPLNFAESFGWLWWSMLIFALFYSGLVPLTDSLTIRSIRNLSVPYTRIRVGGSMGYIFAVTIAGFIIGGFGEKVITPLMTFFCLVALVNSFFIYEQPIDRSVKSAKGDFLKLIKEREIIFFLLLAFLSYMSHAPFNVFFAVHLNNIGYSGEQIGLFIALGVIIEVLIFLFVGNHLKKFNVVYLIGLCFLVGIVRWALVAWYADHITVVILTQLMHCITFAVFHIISIQQIARLFPEQYTSQGQAMYSGLGIGLGGAIGMILAGYIVDLSGTAWTFAFASIMSFIALVVLVISQRSS